MAFPSEPANAMAYGHPLVIFLLALMLLIVWRNDPGRPSYLRAFGVGYAAYGAGVTLQTALWPDALALNVLITGGLYMTAVVGLCWGIVALADRKLFLGATLGIVVTVIGVRGYFSVLDANNVIRSVVLQAGVFVLLAQASWLARSLRHGSFSDRVLWWGFMLFCASALLRVALAVQRPATEYGFDTGAYWVVTQLTIYAFSLVLGMSLLASHAGRRIAEEQRASQCDVLTGLLNRRGFAQSLRKMLRRESHYALLAVDIDHFKAVNDTHGHAAGDSVLRDAARLIQDGTRRHDIAARVGGEEFALVMPGAGLVEAHEAAERLRTDFERHKFRVEGQSIRCTVSVGVAVMAGSVPVANGLKFADRLLYGAKNAGRNRVVCADYRQDSGERLVRISE